MTKRFQYNSKTGRMCDTQSNTQCSSNMLHMETWLNELNHRNVKLVKENEILKSENNMLKVTIGRNEAYIKRLTHQSEWNKASETKKDYIGWKRM